uniref:Uncharacterized protein n=1 Tax=Glossina palpalis gambiensis TaxID=67801 RepID=A0A1B0BW92_9MUSC
MQVKIAWLSAEVCMHMFLYYYFAIVADDSFNVWLSVRKGYTDLHIAFVKASNSKLIRQFCTRVARNDLFVIVLADVNKGYSATLFLYTLPVMSLALNIAFY